MKNKILPLISLIVSIGAIVFSLIVLVDGVKTHSKNTNIFVVLLIATACVFAICVTNFIFACINSKKEDDTAAQKEENEAKADEQESTVDEEKTEDIIEEILENLDDNIIEEIDE